jgi:hypothetical protein
MPPCNASKRHSMPRGRVSCRAQTEARLIALHLDAYQALIARGFVGEENRLAWIEAVHLANRDARLYGLSYTLSPRTAAPASLAGSMPLKQTRMAVKMPLLVETDLPRFLDALHARATGLFRVNRCRLARITDVSAAAGQPPRTRCRMRTAVVYRGDRRKGL